MADSAQFNFCSSLPRLRSIFQPRRFAARRTFCLLADARTAGCFSVVGGGDDNRCTYGMTAVTCSFAG